MKFDYDLFISYARANSDIANYIVEQIERRGYRCFIDSRDIRRGYDFEDEIFRAIPKSTAILLILSKESNDSSNVKSEIKTAAEKGRPIFPLRIGNDFDLSAKLGYYISSIQRLDAFPKVLDVHLDEIVHFISEISTAENIPSGMNNTVPDFKYDGYGIVDPEPLRTADTGTANTAPDSKHDDYRIVGPELLRIADISKIGMDYTDLTKREIEIDYLCIPSNTYEMNDEIEGTFDEWKESALDEDDTSILLVEKDEVIGYCDMYPVEQDAYEKLISGKEIIRDSMIGLYSLGGTFDVYIAMVGIVPDRNSQKNYRMIFGWIFNHLDEWAEDDLHVDRVGISVYNDKLEMFIKTLGFKYKGLNPAKGKVYETSVEALKENPTIKRRYPNFCR